LNTYLKVPKLRFNFFLSFWFLSIFKNRPSHSRQLSQAGCPMLTVPTETPSPCAKELKLRMPPNGSLAQSYAETPTGSNTHVIAKLK
jgi:hypothetical protein